MISSIGLVISDCAMTRLCRYQSFVLFFILEFISGISSNYWKPLRYLTHRPAIHSPTHLKSPIPFFRRSLDSETQCGQRNRLDFKIVGGSKAAKGAWPWLVALGYREDSFLPSFQCGGTLITPNIVLTAAHCVHERPELYMVRLGENDLRSILGIDMIITESIIHGAYKPASNENDIALLKLRDSARISRRIRPICLPSENITNTKARRVWIAGWGATVYDGIASPHLLQINLRLLENSVCKKAYEIFGKSAVVDNRILCAGVQLAGKDACQGDSGGPLMWDDGTGTFHILGIISFGYKCAEPNFPGVYTSVSAFLPWIKKQMLVLESN